MKISFTDKLSGEEAKKKFKNLHDAYRRIIYSENHPSGSARAPLPKNGIIIIP